MKILLTIFLLLSDTNPLDSYQWKNRVLLVFGDSADLLSKQKELFQVEKDGFIDRDIKVFIFDKDKEKGNHPFTKKEVEIIQDLYNENQGPFRILLIGKDGGIKLTDTQPITTKHLFAVIDGMPMRRQEMKNN